MTKQEISLKYTADWFERKCQQAEIEDNYKAWLKEQVYKQSERDRYWKAYLEEQRDVRTKTGRGLVLLAGAAIGGLFGMPYVIPTGGLSVFLGIAIGTIVGYIAGNVRVKIFR